MTAASARKRAKIKGRGKTASFLLLTHHMLNSVEFAALSPRATKLLLEIARKYDGKNNGNLSIAWSECHARGWKSKSMLKRARDELLDASFILTTRHGRNRTCLLYALTWQAIDACEKVTLEVAPTNVPSHAWRKTK